MAGGATTFIGVALMLWPVLLHGQLQDPGQGLQPSTLEQTGQVKDRLLAEHSEDRMIKRQTGKEAGASGRPKPAQRKAAQQDRSGSGRATKGSDVQWLETGDPLGNFVIGSTSMKKFATSWHCAFCTAHAARISALRFCYADDLEAMIWPYGCAVPPNNDNQISAAGAGPELQTERGHQAAARGYESVEDLLLLSKGSDNTAAESRDTQRGNQSKERHASGNQDSNTDGDITADTEDIVLKASSAEEFVTDTGAATQQQRRKALAQDGASRQRRATKVLTRGEGEASGADRGTVDEEDHPEDSDMARSQSAAADESQSGGLPRVWPIEHPELLDGAMIEALAAPEKLPRQDLPTKEQLAEERAKYRKETARKKEEVYQHYLKRKALIFAQAVQDDYMRSKEWKSKAAATAERLEQGGLTRGIVIPAGGPVLLANAWASIKVLRRVLGCKLPIEIIYDGEHEMSQAAVAEFERTFEDVKAINAENVPRPRHGRQIPRYRPDTPDAKGQMDLSKHYEAAGFIEKVFALCYVTSFDEVVFMDADNMALQDPEHLFETHEYQAHGCLFWPDFWNAEVGIIPYTPAAYTLLGLNAPWTSDPQGFAATESGQFLINRVRHAEVLEWIWFVNTHHEVIYKSFPGDANTFRLGFHLAGRAAEYMQIKVKPGIALDGRLKKERRAQGVWPVEESSADYLFSGMVQHSPDGHVVFHHRAGHEAKFHPYRKTFRRMDLFTVPLEPETSIRFTEHKTGGYNVDEVDLQAYRDCQIPDEQLFLLMCGVDPSTTTLPLPVLEVSTIPRISRVMNAAYQTYADLMV